IVGALVLVAYPWVMSPSQTNLGSLFAIYGIVVLSLVVLTGWGGQISLGQFGFVAVGGVVGGALISRAHWPFLIALLVGSLAGAHFVRAGSEYPDLPDGGDRRARFGAGRAHRRDLSRPAEPVRHEQRGPATGQRRRAAVAAARVPGRAGCGRLQGARRRATA